MDAVKDQSAESANTTKSKLRYPLRSARKPKDEKSSIEDVSTTSASKRGKPASSVSKSVSVLDLSGKEKSTNPPRRLSIPAKSNFSPIPRPFSTITPISEARAKRSNRGQGKTDTDTPTSDVSKSINRKKYSVLSSSSYWLTQIKLSESAAKHSISLGFFKLALEAGCEPLQRMQNELKSYANRHKLSEFGDTFKELLGSYNILDDLEQLQVSETISQIPEEGTRSSDEDVNSSTTTSAVGKLKPKSLYSENTIPSSVIGSVKKEVIHKKDNATRNREILNKNSMNSSPATDIRGGKSIKKSHRPNKQESSNKEKEKMKNLEKKLAGEKDPVDPLPSAEMQQEDKENMDAPQREEISLTQEVM